MIKIILITSSEQLETPIITVDTVNNKIIFLVVIIDNKIVVREIIVRTMHPAQFNYKFNSNYVFENQQY